MIHRFIPIYIIIFAVGFAGCHFSRNRETQPQVPDTKYFVHKVAGRPETIKEIAKWYTGKIDTWRAIAGANPFLDSARIRTGDTVLIPLSLVINTKPFPEPKENFKKIKGTKNRKDVADTSSESDSAESAVDTSTPETTSNSAVVEATPGVTQPVTQEVSTTTVQPVPTVQPTVPSPPGERSIDELIAEEQKALELLKSELGQK